VNIQTLLIISYCSLNYFS